MTTSYAVKKCKHFGFAISLQEAVKLFDLSDNENIIYLNSNHKNSIKDPTERKVITSLKRSSSYQEPTTISDIRVPTSTTATRFNKLAQHVNKETRVLQHSDNDEQFILNFQPPDDSNDYTEYKKALISYTNNKDVFRDKELSMSFIKFIISLYPGLQDGETKLSILELLNNNGYNTVDLEQQNPITYNTVMTERVCSTPAFEDIEISIDRDDKNSSTALYRPDKDALKKAALGHSNQLDAFSENKFAVIHTKKSAYIDNNIRNQNHDVLDTLAVNGVLKSPNTNKPLSVFKLMKKLEEFDSFNVIFIHPSLEIKSIKSEYPCEQVVPAYKLNEGEILAVVYRYITIYFFGYCSIMTDSMMEWRYYI